MASRRDNGCSARMATRYPTWRMELRLRSQCWMQSPPMRRCQGNMPSNSGQRWRSSSCKEATQFNEHYSIEPEPSLESTSLGTWSTSSGMTLPERRPRRNGLGLRPSLEQKGATTGQPEVDGILAAAKHLRPAEHPEVSEMMRLKTALREMEAILNDEFEIEADRQAEQDPQRQVPALPQPSDAEMQVDMDVEQVGMPISGDRRRKALQAETEHRRMRKQAKLLDDDDVPLQIRDRRSGVGIPVPQEQDETFLAENLAYYIKRPLTDEAMQKALDKELPWHMIPLQEREMYCEAESKQWKEHVDFGAVRPLSLEESAEVRKRIDKSRILPARFLYRDKNRAKRRAQPEVECKPKARLCVGGQRDPDLGNIEMSVDAPAANRHSVLLGIMLALARGWKIPPRDHALLSVISSQMPFLVKTTPPSLDAVAFHFLIVLVKTQLVVVQLLLHKVPDVRLRCQ